MKELKRFQPKTGVASKRGGLNAGKVVTNIADRERRGRNEETS